MDQVRINLRGTIFITRLSTLKKAPDESKLAECANPEGRRHRSDEYFFDRNPALFHHILDFLASGKLHVPSNVCAESAREEFRYWGIPDGHVEQCCWKSFYQVKEDMDILQRLLKSISLEGKCGFDCSYESYSAQNHKCSKAEEDVKFKLFEFLNDNTSSLGAKIWYGFICLAILTSTVLFLLSSVSTFRVERTTVISYKEDVLDLPTNKSMLYWETTMHPAMMWIDIGCNALLTIEWAIRFLSCPDRKKFICTCINIIDIVSCVSIWVACFIEGHREIFSFIGSHDIMLVLGLIYCSRITRVFRLAYNNCDMRILILTLRSSLRELCVLILSFACFSLIFATLIYMAEMSNANYSDIFVSIWWSIITMTTVGYGDFIPKTVQGYVVGSLCSIAGILLIALPLAIISSNFHSFFSYNQYRRRFWQDICKTSPNIKSSSCDKDKYSLNTKSSCPESQK